MVDNLIANETWDYQDFDYFHVKCVLFFFYTEILRFIHVVYHKYAYLDELAFTLGLPFAKTGSA